MAKSKIEQRVTLFFIAGPRPTDDEETSAAELGERHGIVKFRNAAKATCDGALEPFHAVAGLVPDCYADEAARKAGEALPEPETPKVAVPSRASPIARETAPKTPAAKPAAASVWKPNA